MPVTLTYPGVYIEEIPSGVRTITGVATSIAAFVGWAPQGPTTAATLVQSWADYQRQFGGLNPNSLLSYSLYQFFSNGGGQAYIVRLAAGDAASGLLKVDANLTLTASSPGGWGNGYGIAVKNSAVAGQFRLTVYSLQTKSGGTVVATPAETYTGLTMGPGPRNVVNVLLSSSQILRATVADPTAAPPADTTGKLAVDPAGNDVIGKPLAGGLDGDGLTPGTAPFQTALLPVSGTGGVHLLDQIDLFNLLCVPGENDPATLSQLQAICVRRRAFLIADCAPDATVTSLQNGPNGTLTGDNSRNAAFYFPWVNVPDPLAGNTPKALPPSGLVAGLYAATDAARGVWKAPAGTDASLTGILGLTQTITNEQNGLLNPHAVNCLRTFPVYGTVIWGARTLRGADELADTDNKYVPVRRLTLFIEESLYRGTQWVVFEPNDEPLWAQIRLNVGSFMQTLFRQGAFQGSTPHAAYFVKCDGETTTQSDINLGIVNIHVGFAPLKPAEFVVIQLQQMAGQLAV